jgi:hypothetical protein
MTEQTNAATPEVVAVDAPAAEPAPVYYEVKLSRRITIQDFPYLPSHQHTVDKAIYDAMVAEGVITDVKQLS